MARRKAQPENLVHRPRKLKKKHSGDPLLPTTHVNKECELKAGYDIVLRALKVANLAFGRAVNIDEIGKAILPQETKQLEKTYAQDLRHTISYILTRLTPTGLIFSPGKIHIYRYYGSVDVLDPQSTPLPLIRSRRQRVLELVRTAISEVGQALRMGDIFEYSAGNPEFSDLPKSLISGSVMSLAETGELRVVGSIRGDSKGTNLYLPRELDPALYTPTEPLSWMQEITRAFEELWDESIKIPSGGNQKPRPISTGEIRAKISSSSPAHPHLKSPYDLINSLQQLARSDRPVLRKVKRPGRKALLWAPANITDEELNIKDTYANDSERIEEAVKRAIDRLRRPVNIRDIKEEIKLDQALQLSGSSKLYGVIADVAKESVDAGDGKGRVKRAAQRIYKVGKINGEAYYCADNVPEAQAFVKFHQLKSQWLGANHEEDLNKLETCSLPSIAIGRARLIEVEAKAILKGLNNLLNSQHLDAPRHREAEELREHANEVVNNAKQWLDLRSTVPIKLPSNIDTSVPGLTAQELLQILKPLYPRAPNITRSAKLISLTFGSIRRIPNPRFERRFSKDPYVAAEFLFDRTDALLYAAKQWGGHECCFQAMLAGSELGRLRDVRFVIPVLDSNEFESRLIGIACLAFLWSNDGNKRLRDIAINDPDPGIRQSALWAYGFAGGEKSFELLFKQERNDPHSHVRAFAEKTLVSSQGSWWTI